MRKIAKRFGVELRPGSGVRIVIRLDLEHISAELNLNSQFCADEGV